MLEVNFYSISEDVSAFIYSLLYQMNSKSNQSILLYSTSMEKLKKFDEYLWISGGNADFLPHSIFDKDFKNNDKLLLSNELINSNNADCLLLSSFVDDADFLKSFKKIYYIFTKLSDPSVRQARSSLKLFKDLNCNIIINEKDALTKKWTVLEEF
ncbi:MAG: DNA polymerase III subunit chi [Rickettsiales bacterium]|nr:DNA polymerase III subunit chi [Rickettsiales bacterium]